MDKRELLKLADGIDACVEDALRPTPYMGSAHITVGPPHGVICLCNAMERIADALRALAKEDS